MKILQIFGAVVAVHLLAFIFIFASPGCQSGPRTMPTPDATLPAGTKGETPTAFTAPSANPQPVDLGTPPVAYTPAPSAGHSTPTRPGSAAAVAVTPPKPVENVAAVSNYVVERGDSLWSIAKKHGMTVAELAKLNSISTGTALKPGRKLFVPGKPGAAPAEPALVAPALKTPTPVRPANGEVLKHTVAVGESLGVIARKYGVSTGDLAEANNIGDLSKVRAGQQLVIPAGKGAANRGPSATPVAKPAATEAPAADKPAPPHFDISPPPPGQDLDSGLKPNETAVPTIRVENAPAATPKN